MPLGTLDRRAPPLFRQGISVSGKTLLYAAIALVLMLADGKLHFLHPIKSGVQSVLYPVQRMVQQPALWWQSMSEHFDDLEAAQQEAIASREAMAAQALRAAQVESLQAENSRLRQLLDIRQRLHYTSTVAEVVFETSDYYRRSVVINKGKLHGIETGSAVITPEGVLGQVTHVNLHNSEVSLLISDDYTIAIRNARSAERNIAFGMPTRDRSQGKMELRFVATDADIRIGDVLTTSGIDGVYPSGLLVATVESIQKRNDSAYMRVVCQPFAAINGQQVLVVRPVGLDGQSAPFADANADATMAGAAGNRAITSATPVPPSAQTSAQQP